MMDHLEYCDLLEVEIENFAQVLAQTDTDLEVPSCPGWTVLQLTEHMGEVHRWSEHLVRVLAPQRIGASEMGLDQGPATPDWIRQGGRTLLSTLRSADPNAPMWAWGADQHARFWSRRELHETMVHRIDIQIAGSMAPQADPMLAADAIDELLVNLPKSAYFSPKVKLLKGDGERLGLSANDWPWARTVTLHSEGFEVAEEGEDHTTSISGPALELMLVLYRRSALSSPGIAIQGDSELARFWWANSALE